MLLEGTGILPNSSSCYVHAENFKLLPHSLGKTTVNLHYTHIILPSIEKIPKFSEEVVLHFDATSPVHLQHLDEISVRVTSRSQMRGAKVTRVINAFRDADVHHQPMPWLWFVSIIVVSLVIGSLWPIWLRFVKYCYTYIHKQVTTFA
jgi:hypothetical protein